MLQCNRTLLASCWHFTTLYAIVAKSARSVGRARDSYSRVVGSLGAKICPGDVLSSGLGGGCCDGLLSASMRARWLLCNLPVADGISQVIRLLEDDTPSSRFFLFSIFGIYVQIQRNNKKKNFFCNYFTTYISLFPIGYRVNLYFFKVAFSYWLSLLFYLWNTVGPSFLRSATRGFYLPPLLT